MTNKILPSYLLAKQGVIGTVLFTVLFAIVFLNLYVPFSDTAWFSLGGSANFLNTLTFASSSILMLIVSRVVMYMYNKRRPVTWLAYGLWCIIEIALVCLLYTEISMTVDLLDERTHLAIFRHAFPHCCIALGIPYFMSATYLTIMDKNKIIKLMNYENVAIDEEPKAESPLKKITLFDNNGTLRMSVSLDNLYCIQSDESYIKVWYTDSQGQLQRYLLRCRLKTVEESFKGSGLIRCSRQFIVNMNKVGNMRKENGGYVLELDNQAIPPISVTKSYTEKVLSYFTEYGPLMDPID